MWPSRTLFIGPAAEAHRLAQLLDAPHQATGYQLVGYVDPDRQGPAPDLDSPPAFPPDSEVPALIQREDIREVFIRLAHADLDRLMTLYHQMAPLGVRIRVSLSHFGALRDRVPVLPEAEHGYVFINASPLRPVEQQLKYGLDRLAGGLGLLVLAPVFALLALLIKLDSRGPVFFRQSRVGRGGRVFSVYKFRTMTENTEAEHKVAIRKLVEGDHAFIEAQSGQAGVLKVTNASKVTRLGGWLRRTSLDELPQLINVWTGDMSLVGPPSPCPATKWICSSPGSIPVTI
jgi:lipopolysaccharide/colanic/teichoic acid biosynthesis glycosyltransferase